MMIPIPQRGIYHGVEGLATAQSVPGVTGVTITAQPGQIIAPPPDGASYLGFIFSRADDPRGCRNGAAHRPSQSELRYPPRVPGGGDNYRERLTHTAGVRFAVGFLQWLPSRGRRPRCPANASRTTK